MYVAILEVICRYCILENGLMEFIIENDVGITGPLFGPEPYKHPKITKLNHNTPWIKYNKKTINIV
jgi:hypothetical protein